MMLNVDRKNKKWRVVQQHTGRVLAEVDTLEVHIPCRLIPYCGRGVLAVDGQFREDENKGHIYASTIQQ